MLRRILLVLTISILILVACQSGTSSSVGGGGAETEPSDTPARPEPASSPAVRKGSTIHATPVPVEPTQRVRSAEPSATPKVDAPTLRFSLCSPLVDTPLVDLPSIISDPYRPPPPGSEARHHGVDFAYFRKFNRAAIEGAGVQSVLKGQVAAAIVDSFPYGNMLIIETPGASLPPELVDLIQISGGESLYILYAHMERPPSLSLGESVEACAPLGTVGKSGNAGGTHLHLETRLGPAGTRFTSMAYYKAWATEEQRANYLLWRISGTYRHFDPMLVLSYRQ